MKAEPSDADLVLSARAGEAAAFRLLYERYAPKLYGLCVRATGDRDAGRDLLQEIFLRAHRSLGQLREPERVREWLFAIAMNAIRAHRGSEKRRGELLERYEVELFRADPNGSESRSLRRELHIHAVREVLAEVSDSKEGVLLRRYYADEREPTTRELALELGMPPSTVTVTLMRARARIAKRLLAALVALDTDPLREGGGG
jgi:RNA polymerase sigma factor (sigma-70 family)